MTFCAHKYFAYSIRYSTIIIALCFPLISYADLSDLKAYSPIVEKSERGLEILGNTTFDNENDKGSFQYHEFEFEYGVTDRWATSIVASLIKPAMGPLHYDISGWENTFQFAEEGTHWLDFGMHIEIELEDENSKPHNLELRFLFEKKFAEYQHLFNFII